MNMLVLGNVGEPLSIGDEVAFGDDGKIYKVATMTKRRQKLPDCDCGAIKARTPHAHECSRWKSAQRQGVNP